MLASLRDGGWITIERLRAYCLMLVIAYALGFASLAVASRDGVDGQGRALGSDFAEVYAAGTLVDRGEPARPYDSAAHFERQREIFGPKTAIYTWNYPPFFLAVAGLLAGLPYLAALLAWMLATLPVYLAAARGFLNVREAWLGALAFPAVFSNLGHGQTGFLAAGLFAGGLALLDRRPVFAGVLLALLAFKPQFGLLIPFALAAGGRWKTMAAATATLAVMVGATLLAWGPGVWSPFLGGLPEARLHGLEYSNTGFYKMQSLFAAVRMLGGPVPLAYALHATLLAAVVACVVGVWRGEVDFRLKAAALLVGALLATPYCFDYDMVIEGPALAALISYGLARGFVPWEKTILAAAFAAPLLARPLAMVTALPIGLASLLMVFALVVHHAATNGAPSRAASRRFAGA